MEEEQKNQHRSCIFRLYRRSTIFQLDPKCNRDPSDIGMAVVP